MKSAIIFGAAGQDSFYLNQILSSRNVEVTNVSRSKGDWITGSVSDGNFVKTLIQEIQPDFIFHLAANSTTRHEAQFENHETISTGTLNILESVWKYSRHSRAFISGSGLQFVNRGTAIIETDPFDPSSAYSVSRIHSVYASRYYRKLGLKVYVGYFFNHDSPLRSERHVNQKIVSAVKRISAGSTEILELGDISTTKEFGFAADSMEAIYKLVTNEIVFEAVIGTGKPYEIREWLNICFEKFGMDWQKHVVLKQDFIAEYNALFSNPETIFSLGWRPKVNINELADLMIKYQQ